MMEEVKHTMGKAREAALAGEWETIDDKLVPSLMQKDHLMVMEQLPNLLTDANEDLHDLGCTIFAKLDVPQDKAFELKPHVVEILNNDENIYSRFRATLALQKHGLYDREHKKAMNDVLQAILSSEEDADLHGLAKEAIKNLKSFGV